MSTFLVLMATVLVTIALTGTFLSRRARRRFEAAGDTFACGMRLEEGSPPGWFSGRDDTSGRGLWVHDVLLVQRGRWLPRLVALRVRLPEDSIRPATRSEFQGLGYAPLVIELRLDDGALVAVAARPWDREQLAGPFLAAAVASMPPRSEKRY